MYIYHNSREIEYRSPFGATLTDGEVRLRVRTDCVPDKIYVRIWQNGETFVSLENVGELTFSVVLKMPNKPCLLWYFFVAEKDGKRYFCHRSDMGGCDTFEYCNNSSWQITVFDKNFRTPEWFKNSVMYQIFPDRFFRKGKIEEMPEKKSEYIIHEDWYEPPCSTPHPFEDGPACNDFYGGNLLGIMEKVPYLKSIGISVIYMNPIFEAFSNHRYDTGDYTKIDPVLGTERGFELLCKCCEENGIRVILDGVFSHTGSDSVYFNKYGNYGENCGAYRDENSPYRGWYQWNERGYDSWWGCSNLPNVNELEPTYIDYILRRDDAIIKKWLKLGASGWRLDVADELPDEFIKILRREVKSQKPDAVIIGEVWEDASNKESYGKLREYLLGDELDSVMNYPFKDNVLGFLTEMIDAEVLEHRLMTIMENYPAESLYSAMNILGTHDTVRLKNVLSGQVIDYTMTEEQKASFRLDAKCETLAVSRMKLGFFLLMTFVGVPCIYYGDEIGMQGLGDPWNRMPYTWRCVDEELRAFCKKMIEIRNSYDCLRCGEYKTLYAKGGFFAFERTISENKDVFGNDAHNSCAICVINRDKYSAEAVVNTEISGEYTELISGVRRMFQKGENRISLQGLDCAVFVVG